jgi:hypothetical protein
MPLEARYSLTSRSASFWSNVAFPIFDAEGSIFDAEGCSPVLKTDEKLDQMPPDPDEFCDDVPVLAVAAGFAGSGSFPPPRLDSDGSEDAQPVTHRQIDVARSMRFMEPPVCNTLLSLGGAPTRNLNQA